MISNHSKVSNQAPLPPDPAYISCSSLRDTAVLREQSRDDPTTCKSPRRKYKSLALLTASASTRIIPRLNTPANNVCTQVQHLHIPNNGQTMVLPHCWPCRRPIDILPPRLAWHSTDMEASTPSLQQPRLLRRSPRHARLRRDMDIQRLV